MLHRVEVGRQRVGRYARSAGAEAIERFNSAAIVYGPRGPMILVALTFRPGLARSSAAALGRDLVTLVGLP